jgi:uncharacterized protein YuzE
MKFHFDKQVDALYIRFNDKRYVESDQVSDDVIFDYDKQGLIIGIEVLNASKRFPKEFHKHLHNKQLSIQVA